MVQRIVPAVVVREVQDRAVWAANNKRVHVREFGAVRNFNGVFDLRHVGGLEAAGVEGLSAKQPETVNMSNVGVGQNHR